MATIALFVVLTAVGISAFLWLEPEFTGRGGRTVVKYEPLEEDFLNPERGFHDWIELVVDDQAQHDFAYVRELGSTLAFAYLRLDAFRYRRIDEQTLKAFTDALASVRRHGIKLILRVAYRTGDLAMSTDSSVSTTDTGSTGSADSAMSVDASIDQMTQHVRQLRPLLAANADIIAVMQAGMIGPWGEWHDASHELDSPDARARILDLALQLAPLNRFVQLRRPFHLVEQFPSVLNPAEYYGSSPAARVGHHNDCFLSNEDDSGTYQPSARAAEMRTYVRSLARHAPIGGETCRHPSDSGRTSCKEALMELAEYRWSFLNKRFYEPDIRRWQHEGCYHEIATRLGYRFLLVESAVDATLQVGERFDLQLVLRNDGFAQMYNPRLFHLVLEDEAGNRQSIDLGDADVHVLFEDQSIDMMTSVDGSIDPRRWMPAPGETVVRRLSPRLPLLASGHWRLSLHMPDPAPALQSRPEFAIRTANRGVWDASTGLNDLQLVFDIDEHGKGRSRSVP